MKLFHSFILILLLLCQGSLAHGQVLHVVTNDKNLGALSKKQIKQIYMAGDFIDIEPLALAKGNHLRVVFNHAVMGLQESRINAYWAQMKFSGRAEPPREFSNEEDILSYLQENPGCIAYLPGHIQIPNTLKIIYSLNY